MSTETSSQNDAPICANYIAGVQESATVSTFLPLFNPSTGELIAQVPSCGTEDANLAVAAAHHAFSSWSCVPAVDRARILFRYKYLLEENFEALARLITREHGKTLQESRGDLRRGIDVVDFACGIPSLAMGQGLDNVARGIDAQIIREPIGVCVGITPYNFPAMVPMWMYPVAVACGNTFILKPSPKVPLTAIRLAELFTEAGLPSGVFNVLLGGSEAVESLLGS